MLCYSTSSLPPVPVKQWLDILEPTAFRGIELVLTPDMLAQNPIESFFTNLRSEVEARGFRVQNIHLGNPLLLSQVPHEPGLASSSKSDREQRLKAAEIGVKAAILTGSPHLTLTTGLQPENVSMQQCLSWIQEGLEQLMELTKAQTMICLEQEPEMVIHSASQLHQLCQKYSGSLGVTYDVGHAHVLEENISRELKRLSPWLQNLHLEDISGNIHKHLLFGEGDIDFTAIFQTLREINYTKDITPDLYPYADQHEKALTASMQFLKQNWLNE